MITQNNGKTVPKRSDSNLQQQLTKEFNYLVFLWHANRRQEMDKMLLSHSCKYSVQYLLWLNSGEVDSKIRQKIRKHVLILLINSDCEYLNQ